MEPQEKSSNERALSNQSDAGNQDRQRWIEKPIAVSVGLALAIYVLSWGGVFLVQEYLQEFDFDLLGFVFYVSSVLPIIPILIVLVGGVWSVVRKSKSVLCDPHGRNCGAVGSANRDKNPEAPSESSPDPSEIT